MSPSLGSFSVREKRVMRRGLQLPNPIVYCIVGACPCFNMYNYGQWPFHASYMLEVGNSDFVLIDHPDYALIDPV